MRRISGGRVAAEMERIMRQCEWSSFGARRAFLPAVVLGLVVTFGACSSSSKSSNASATTSPSPAAAPLKIGFILDKSGPNGPGQGDVASAVAQAWEKYTNAHGGVAGHPVDIEIKDTAGDPTNGQATAAAMVADKSIVAVLLVDASSESTYAKTLSDAGLPVVGGLGYHPDLWGVLPNVFGITTTYPTAVTMQAQAAKSVGATKVSSAICAEIDTCASAVPILQAAVEKAGMIYGGTVKVAANASDFTAECLQFVNNHTDFIQLSASAAVVIRVYNDCVQQGFDGFVGASGGSVVSTLYDAPNIRLAGAINGFPWWTDDPPVEQFRAVMAAGGVSEKTYGAPTGTATYASLELFKKTMGKAPLSASPTRADVLAAYRTIKDETLGGLLPMPLTFTSGKSPAQIPCFWLYTYENSKFAGTLKPTCEAPS